MNHISTFQTSLGAKNKFTGIKPGWTIRINQRIQEGSKTRVQAFEGMVISQKHGAEGGATITVRKTTDGIGVEKTFPVYLPSIESVAIIKKSKTRRAKLYYLRDKTAKEIRKKVRTEIATVKKVAGTEEASQ
jgi:large subunit ribosomal protein L19